MRLNKPIGLILLACPAFLAVSQQQEPFQFKTVLIFIGILLTRSLGCLLNDIADRDIDRSVQRTASRPLASKDFSLYHAFGWSIILSSACFLLLLSVSFNALPIIGAAGLSLVIYPYTKRFFALPQVFLGMSFASSILVVYAIFETDYSLVTLNLFLATLCWVISFDTLYALNDLEDDIKLPIYSLPKTLGFKKSLWLAQSFLVIAHLLILLQQQLSLYTLPFLLISTMLTVFIIYKTMINTKNFMHLFHLNGLLGISWCLLSFFSEHAPKL
jgi:4-hydroxybenzoate polyprenyltransferase